MEIPTDNMSISKDTSFQPGVYFLPHGITIAADGVNLDGNGALMVGSQRSGYGFHLFDTCDSSYEENSADYCCRVERPSPASDYIYCSHRICNPAETKKFVSHQALFWILSQE